MIINPKYGENDDDDENDNIDGSGDKGEYAEAKENDGDLVLDATCIPSTKAPFYE
jgi:hypothetical protein